MFKSKAILINLILILGDAFSLYLALFLTLVIRYQDRFNLIIWQEHWPIFSGLFFVWLVIFYGLDMYGPRPGPDTFSRLLPILKTALIVLIVGIIFFYIVPTGKNITPKTILLINIALAVILNFLWRETIKFARHKSNKFINLYFIGFHPILEEIINDWRLKTSGYKFSGIYSDDYQGKLTKVQLDQLAQAVSQDQLSLLVLAESKKYSDDLSIRELLKKSTKFQDLPSFYENLFERVPVDLIDNFWILANFSQGQKKLFYRSKRIMDIILAGVLLIVSLPLLPFIALAVKLSDGGPVFFRQIRSGQNGRNFQALKFRTMTIGSEGTGPSFAAANDPRVTQAGKFLRRTRLDEIPQLINILRGEMSFVGPRPERPYFIEQFAHSVPFYEQRLLVKPGLTGWAQINQNYQESTNPLEKIKFDFYYIKNSSLSFDLKIILKTLNTILAGHG